MDSSLARDVETVGRIAAVPTILEVVARTTGMRFTAVARVTDTHWMACAVYDQLEFGLKPGGELVLETTICNEIRQHRQPVVFGHASAHPHFSTHATPRLYSLESYISIPIFRGDGDFFGTLCAIDPKPALIDDPNLLKTLELFAQLIGAQIDVEERLERSDHALADAHDTAKLREQFIAVLGHDLRNPLHSIKLGTEVLEAMPLETPALRAVGMIRRSTGRMSELIDNILDFARGRLGGGIPVVLRHDDDLVAELAHVVDEIRVAYPQHLIEARLDIGAAVPCDRRRIAQLLANLLANAAIHGAPDAPIRVDASVHGDAFRLEVANGGPAIPAEKMARLFQPFSRRATDAPSPGLGLGLYIAAEVARAHRGTLEASSSAEAGTRFVFRMPMDAAHRHGGADATERDVTVS
jgi:signal transduction histidine kinase